MRDSQRRDRWWDGFLSGVGAVAVLLLSYLATSVSSFRQMYAELGGVPPLVTKLALHPLTAPTLAVLHGGMLVMLNVGCTEPKRWRTLALGLVTASAIGAAALVYAGAYAPIWQLSDAIAPE